jgi:ABC-2 type transport system permease protein
MAAIIKKELHTYFVTMTAYIYLGVFVLLSGLFFITINIDGGSPFFGQSLVQIQILFLILIPTLTMRLFAEEVRQRTDQLLFTSPLKISDVVLGKFTAATLIYTLSLLLLLAFPYALSFFIEVDVREIFGMMLGFFLLGASFIAVGLFVSALTDNQIIAAVATFAVLLLFFLMDMVAASMPVSRVWSGVFVGGVIAALGFYIYISAKNVWASAVFCGVTGGFAVAMRFINPNVYDGLIYRFLMWLNLLSRFFGFARGVLRIADVVYYLTFIGVCLYLTVHVIERRRWK